MSETQRTGDRRSFADRREPVPQGTGEIVMEYVERKVNINIGYSEMKQALPPLMDAGNLRLLLADLKQRTETGTKKYGTPLRVNNGRKAYFDLYQEICDAIMYSAQARMEGDDAGGNYVELLIQIGSQLAGIVNKRG